ELDIDDRTLVLASYVAITLLGLRLGLALDVSAEVLPRHDLLDRFQRIAVGADRLKPALNVEKARLPHDSLAPSAHGPLRSASQIRSDLARRIFQGALQNKFSQIRLCYSSCLFRRYLGHCFFEHGPHDCDECGTKCRHDESPNRAPRSSPPTLPIASRIIVLAWWKWGQTNQFSIKGESISIK